MRIGEQVSLLRDYEAAVRPTPIDVEWGASLVDVWSPLLCEMATTVEGCDGSTPTPLHLTTPST